MFAGHLTVHPVKRIKNLIRFFLGKRHGTSPLFIIRKSGDHDPVHEYNSMEEAITALEDDSNVSPGKIEKLRESLTNLKNTGSIKIRNGELLS